MNKLPLGDEELICSWGNYLWSSGTEMQLSHLMWRASMGFFSSYVLWCSKWYPWCPRLKNLALIHRGLDIRHMGQVRTAGSSYKKSVYKSGVLASATLTKPQFRKRLVLSFALKDLGFIFCTHVFGKRLLWYYLWQSLNTK